MHPFAKARERTRALNAAKIERIFAKPFIAALEGHMEAVETMSRRPESLTAVASGSWDGGMYVLRQRCVLVDCAEDSSPDRPYCA